MDDYAGRVLAERYRLPRTPSGEDEPAETPAFDTYSGQEVLIRQVPLPEVVSAEILVGTGPGEELPDVLSPTDDPGQRALRAARAAAGIPDHPRLVQVFDVFLDGGSLWIATELVPARTLGEVIAEHPLTPYRAAEIGSDVLAALRAVHAERWTHRNVTADTVYVCDDGRAILTGLCAAAAEEALCGNDPVPPASAQLTKSELDGLITAAGRRTPARERARQARIGMIGACTERWAPEQAAPPSENGQVEGQATGGDGPPSDLWALGALLFRSVQGHPPFPEENVLELVSLVRTEPPAFAEECGPLRPVVESLLRKEPADRPGEEEVRGWLRSLIRSAPEPDIGRETVALPADPHKLPEVRRRGEVVRRRQPGSVVRHGRHARARRRGPRLLGGVLVGLAVLLVAAALLVAMVLMPQRGRGNGDVRKPGLAGPSDSAAQIPDLSGDFTLHEDPEGFSLALHDAWRRETTGTNGQVRFTDGDDLDMVVVPGRDKVAEFGGDLKNYQDKHEPELSAYRKAQYGSSDSFRSLTIHGYPAVQGEYHWREADGDAIYARNLVILVRGAYHVILVSGFEDQGSDVSRFFEKAAETYRVTR